MNKIWAFLTAFLIVSAPTALAGQPINLYDAVGHPISSTLNGGQYSLNVNAAFVEAATAATGAAAPALFKVAAGLDGGGLTRPLLTDNTGKLQITSTTASVGTIGAAVPSSADFMGVKDGSGNLLGLTLGQALMAASLPVTLSSNQSALAITAAALPLPAGASTSANQTTEIADLVAISGQLPATLGQKTMAASEAVTIASNQSAIPVSQSGTWDINNINGTVSLPTGAATAANQTTINTNITNMSAKLPAALGQTTMANSMSVTLASNQSALPSIADNTASGTIVATNGTITLTTNGAATTAIQLTGVWSGNVSFNATVDGSTYFNIICTAANGSNVGNSSANGHWQCPTAGYSKIQLIGSAWVSGTVTGTMISSIGTSLVYAQNFSQGNLLVQASPSNTANTTPWLFTINQGGNSASVTGSNALKVDGSAVTQPVSISGNQAVNVAQINGVTPLMGNGVTGTGSQRVTIASDNSTISVNQAGRAKANAPVRNDYTSTNVTTAAYVQLVASTTSATSMICVFDSSGQTLTIATGAAASEVNQMNVFPGGNGCEPLTIAAGTRVSIKSLSATASVGELDVNFYQ